MVNESRAYRNRWKYLCAGLTSVMLVLGLTPMSWARDDLQVWNTIELSKRLGPHWEVFFLPEIRIRDDAGEFFYHEYRQGVRYKPSKHWQLGLNYLFVRNESSGKPLEEHTGELDLTPKTTLGPLEVSLRGRLALRTIQGSTGEQEWQFRVMPKVAYPTQFVGHKLIPYAADDLYYDYTRDAWNQNRVFLGLAIPMGKALGAETTVDVYYMLQSQLGKRHDWSSSHVLGTKLSVRF